MAATGIWYERWYTLSFSYPPLTHLETAPSHFCTNLSYQPPATATFCRHCGALGPATVRLCFPNVPNNLKEHDFILGAPAQDSTSILETSSSTLASPHPFLPRWNTLNTIFEGIFNARPKKARVDESTPRSTAYSSAQWKDLECVYGDLFANFEISPKNFEESKFNILWGYITMLVECIDDINFGKEALRMQFIAPVIIAVCSAHAGVTILFENDLDGKRLHVSGHFEMMIKKENKRICIIEAKKEDIAQGLCQALLGCDAVVDVDGLEVVYGIVTSCAEWAFTKTNVNDNKILKSNMTLKMGNNGMPDRVDLLNLCGIINAILLD